MMAGKLGYTSIPMYISGSWKHNLNLIGPRDFSRMPAIDDLYTVEPDIPHVRLT